MVMILRVVVMKALRLLLLPPSSRTTWTTMILMTVGVNGTLHILLASVPLHHMTRRASRMIVMMMTTVATMTVLLLPFPSPLHARMMVVKVVVKQATSLLQMPAASRATMATRVLMQPTKMVLPESSLCAKTRATTIVTPVLPMMAKQKVLRLWREQMMMHHQRNKKKAPQVPYFLTTA